MASTARLQEAAGNMEDVSTFQIITEIPRFVASQVLTPLKRVLSTPASAPGSQAELAKLVNGTLHHEIRAGYEHRFIRLMFVAAGDRIFCRQYKFSGRSWRDVFLNNPEGQIRLDNTVVDIDALVPPDLDAINPAVDRAYADALAKIGASFMLAGAVETRAQNSTMELILTGKQNKPDAR